MNGESHLVEWKETWRDEYLRWISGFANSEGGTLVIGRNDQGQPVGVADAERLLTEIPNKVRDLLGIIVPVRLVEEQGHKLIEIAVEPQPTPISYRGEYHVRCGSTKQQLTGSALSAFLLRKFGRHWDSAPVPGVTANDLDPEAFKRFRRHASRSERLPAEALQAAAPELLERLHLVEAGMLKRAALLLFHEDPERWVTGAFVKIGMFRTDADLLFHDEVHGDLFRQMEGSIDLLRTKYMIAHITYEGVQRVETFPVPEAALREAVLNALIHKDYAAGTPIQISVYRDKLMIWNPGPLPATWTAERLLQKHPSLPANPDVAHTFFRSGLIEAWGRGFERMAEACRAAGTPGPNVRHDGAGLWTEWQWEEAGQVAGQVTGEVTGEVAGEVTGEVLRLLDVLRGEMTRKEMQVALALSSQGHFRERYLEPALAARYVEMTIPDKPNSRLQRYRLSGAGKAVMAGRGKK